MTTPSGTAPLGATAQTHLRGVSPVLEVPFHADETVDYEGFSLVVEHALGTGVTSVMFPGFASEFHKLADDERERLCRLLLEQTTANPGVAAVIAVQDHASVVAARRARNAITAGADAINLLPPHQFAPSPSALRDHVSTVLQAVAPAPVIVQYAPAQTGTSLEASTLSQLSLAHSNLVAVKVESTPPGHMIAALAAASPPLPAFVGYAGLQLPDALAHGAIGVQPGCSFTELYLRFWGLWQQGQRTAAVALHTRMLPYLSYWMQSVELIVAAEKLITQRRGIIASAQCRRPGYSLDAMEVAHVDAFLAEFRDELAEGAALPLPVRTTNGGLA